MNARLSFRVLLLVLVVAIVVFVGLYFIGHGRSHDLGGVAGGFTAAVNSRAMLRGSWLRRGSFTCMPWLRMKVT
jgi:preprotein translocase subunit SecG